MRDNMKPCVDPQLEGIYINILIEKLEKPEDWKKDSNDSTRYISTPIGGTKTFFRTFGEDSDHDYRDNRISIRSGGQYDSEIHELPINIRKVRRMIRKLHSYMKLKTEWAQYEEIDHRLKKGLPENIDRYLKLTKIRKKL